MAEPGGPGETKRGKRGGGLSLRIIMTIFKKELVDAFRDKRTMFIMIFLPMFFMPLVMIGIPAAVPRKRELGVARQDFSWLHKNRFGTAATL